MNGERCPDCTRSGGHHDSTCPQIEKLQPGDRIITRSKKLKIKPGEPGRKRYVYYTVESCVPCDRGGYTVLARAKGLGYWRFRWHQGHYVKNDFKPSFVKRPIDTDEKP